MANVILESTPVYPEENFFDPVTERECSFIQNVSVDHSTFVADDNKNVDIIMCISDLDIKDLEGTIMTNNGHNFYNIPSLNLKPQNTVMNSEAMFVEKTELDLSKDSPRMAKDKVKLIKDENEGARIKFSKGKVILLIIVISIIIAVFGLYISNKL